jgi:hypothetical protein
MPFLLFSQRNALRQLRRHAAAATPPRVYVYTIQERDADAATASAAPAALVAAADV